jgi:hypothetical protein
MTKPFDEQMKEDFNSALQNECLKYKLNFKTNYTVPTFGFYEGAIWAKQYFDAKVEGLQYERDIAVTANANNFAILSTKITTLEQRIEALRDALKQYGPVGYAEKALTRDDELRGQG